VHNDTPAQQRIRLRMALASGEVHYDEHGVHRYSLNLALRLNDAQPLKAALAPTRVLALLTSNWFFDEVVRHTQARRPRHAPVEWRLRRRPHGWSTCRTPVPPGRPR